MKGKGKRVLNLGGLIELNHPRIIQILTISRYCPPFFPYLSLSLSLSLCSVQLAIEEESNAWSKPKHKLGGGWIVEKHSKERIPPTHRILSNSPPNSPHDHRNKKPRIPPSHVRHASFQVEPSENNPNPDDIQVNTRPSQKTICSQLRLAQLELEDEVQISSNPLFNFRSRVNHQKSASCFSIDTEESTIDMKNYFFP